MNRRIHGLAILLCAGVLVSAACGNKGGTGDMCTPPTKMPATITIAPTGKVINAGDIGSACTVDTQCTQGPTGMTHCWKTNFLDDTTQTAAPGGYCTSKCNIDGDCGPSNSGNFCVDFGTMGRYCLVGCADQVTCRHPDYACSLGGTCLPRTATLTCNPTQDGCMTTITTPPAPGVCLRRSFEDDNGGICYPKCNIGDSCPATTSGAALNCVYVDLNPAGTPFAGTACFVGNTTPTADGAACTVAAECKPGSQCDIDPFVTEAAATKTCRPICNRMGGTCASGTTCHDAFGTCNGAGLCKP